MTSDPAALDAVLRAFRWSPGEDASPSRADADAVTGTVPEAARAFLAFEIGSRPFGLPLEAVSEILRAQALTEMPRRPPPLAGVLNLRGAVAPVYDPACLFGEGPAPVRSGPDAVRPERSARILVLRTALGPAGVWVSRVRGVVRVPASDVGAAPGPEGIVGCVRTPAGDLAVLDPERLLA